MKRIIIMAAVLILLTGCGSEKKFPEVSQDTPSEAIVNASQTVDAGPEQELAETAETQETFDAGQAVSIEEIEGGIQVTFQQLPQTASDMQAIVNLYSQADARNVCAFFHAALVRYPESAEDCFAMMDVLRGPQPLSDTDKAFIKERLSDKLYLPRAYFEGAVPKNEYQPEDPWTIIIYDDPVEPPEGYAYTMVKTSGADSNRRIVMRVKDEQNYLWEYNAALLSIRQPASEDPWA